MKHNVDDIINRYKAQLVAKGYAETHGVVKDSGHREKRSRMGVNVYVHGCTQIKYYVQTNVNSIKLGSRI